MTKTFCDMCESLITDSYPDRVRRKLGKYEVEVIHAVDHCWNAGALCEKCIFKILKEGKPSKGML